jgi:hypothetical protein
MQMYTVIDGHRLSVKVILLKVEKKNYFCHDYGSFSD